MSALSDEIRQAFPNAVAAPYDMRALAPSLKEMGADDFVARLPLFMIASVDDPMEGDPIPAILIGQIPKRAGQLGALSPLQRRVLAKFIASMAGDHELKKGSLLEALTVLKL